jgi:BirA family biotin operon repressor/biotin-[acetyl-CoA-carboxylase] ligase
MELSDLSHQAVAGTLPDRPVRVYQALLSTAADAQAWARSDAPAGALVVADYQASPRGRAGLEWTVVPGRTLAFSLVLRPRLAATREGWIYTVATSGLADVFGGRATIEWPDEVRLGQRRVAAVGVDVQLGPAGCEWTVVNALVTEPPEPRVAALKRAIEAIEARNAQSSEGVLGDYLPRLETIGKHVRARLIPMGPGGPEVVGRAVGSLMDGSLLLERDDARRVAVRPQNLGLLDQLSGATPDSSSC